MGKFMAALIAAVVSTAHPAVAADSFPFDVQNARTGGLVFSVPADPKGSTTSWMRSIRIVGAGDAVVNTENLKVPDEIVVETEAGDSARLAASRLPPKRELAPGASISIDLSGEFTVPGIYKGELVLVLAGTPPRQRVVPIQITVKPVVKSTPVAMPVQDHSAKAVAITENVCGDASTRLAIRLRNTSTEAVKLKPAFATVARVDKADAPTQQIAIPDADATGSETEIAAGDVGRFDLRVDKLDEPGIYAVEAVFKDATVPPRYQAQAVKTIVYRRQSALWAALAIAVGALLAFAVKAFVSDGSKRLALRRRIALLGEHVRAVRSEAVGDEVMNAAKLLELDIADRDRDARWGYSIDDVEKIVARAEKRLALLRSVTAAVGTLALIDASKQAELRKKLDEALVVVRVDPGTDEKIATAQTAVDGLALRAVRRDQILARLADLKLLIAQQKPVGSPSLVATLVEAERPLAGADMLIRSDALEVLDKLLDRALGAVLDACIAELTRLARAPVPPPGVEPGDWAIAAAEVKARLTGAGGTWQQRNAALLDAQRAYFTAAVKGLIKLAKARAASTDSRAAAFKTMAGELEGKLDADPLAAAAMYSQSLETLVSPDPESGGEDGEDDAMSFTLDGSPPAPGWIPLLLGAIHSATVPGASAGSVALDRKLRTTTWLVSTVVLLIAVASGLKALWLDNLSWGGTSAWVAAFLWGAGVQAAGDAFAGLAGLRAKLGG